MGALFSGFESSHVDVGETTIFIQRKGDGPPLLLLHGFPQTHVMWHRIAPALAERFTVICADLRGYGASGKPASHPDHSPYSNLAGVGGRRDRSRDYWWPLFPGTKSERHNRGAAFVLPGSAVVKITACGPYEAGVINPGNECGRDHQRL